MQLVSHNFSLDDVARLSGKGYGSASPARLALRRLPAQNERSVPFEALFQPPFTVAQSFEKQVLSVIRFNTSSYSILPNCARPLFCSSTHAPGHSHCMCCCMSMHHHCMHHC
jgi:hypothetical protein